MCDDTTEPFGFPAIGREKVMAAFDRGRLTSDGGVMLLAAAERQLGICDRLAALITDRRGTSRVVHPVADILRRASWRSHAATRTPMTSTTAAYWLLMILRDRIPRPDELACAEFATLRLHLLTVAGRVIEPASRVRIAFAAACPHAALFRGLARSLLPAGP